MDHRVVLLDGREFLGLGIGKLERPDVTAHKPDEHAG
jgi:hypothetical protein